MASRTYKAHFQTPRDTVDNWEQNNPVLLEGEVVIVYGMGNDKSVTRLKIGDGVSAFNDLPYYSDETRISVLSKGIPNGVATLDENGKIPISQLPDGLLGEQRSIISNVPEQLGRLVYNGEIQMPYMKYYSSDMLIMEGTTQAEDAGTYLASFRPAPGYVWSDGTSDMKYAEWTIERAPGELSADKTEIELLHKAQSTLSIEPTELTLVI